MNLGYTLMLFVFVQSPSHQFVHVEREGGREGDAFVNDGKFSHPFTQ